MPRSPSRFRDSHCRGPSLHVITGLKPCLIAAAVIRCACRKSGEPVEQPDSRPIRAYTRPRGRAAASACAGVAAGADGACMGAWLAASCAAVDCCGALSGGVVGRLVGCIPVHCSRHCVFRFCPPRAAASAFRRSGFAGRRGKMRCVGLIVGRVFAHRPATALTDTLKSQDPIAQALVAGTAGSDAGVHQTHPRRSAVAAPGSSRSVGAAGAGRRADGDDLRRSRQRPFRARGGGI